MKTRLISITILLILFAVLLFRNNKQINNLLLEFINPMKQNYTHFTHDLKDKSKSYLFQKESIENLSHENKILRKRLLEQMHYIQQVKNVYHALPELSKKPIRSISLTDTISYVKLNSFSKIILTKPTRLRDEKLYGLIQNKVVGGIAQLKDNQLFGYLTSDASCQFSVFIGKEKAPGIAMGVSTNTMMIKFIPKWHKIKIGDKVVTSGLDNIFFSNIPVGIVKKIEIQSSYKVAYIQTYADTYHPKIFFLINQAKATLTEKFDANSTYLTPFKIFDTNKTEENLSNAIDMQADQNESNTSIASIPARIDQTKEEIIDPIIPSEMIHIQKYKSTPKSKPKKRTKTRKKSTPKASTLDFF